MWSGVRANSISFSRFHFAFVEWAICDPTKIAVTNLELLVACVPSRNLTPQPMENRLCVRVYIDFLFFIWNLLEDFLQQGIFILW